jgi:AraC family transcriptional regulator
MRSTERRWGDVHIRVVEEHIGFGSDWSHREDDHVIIAHLDGRIRDIETCVEGIGAPVGPLSAGNVSLIPARRSYHAQAHGGLVRYATVRVAPRALQQSIGEDMIAGGMVRLVHGDPFLYGAVQRLAGLAARTDDVSHMVAHSVSHAALHHLHDTYGADGRGAVVDRDVPLLTVSAATLLQQFVREHLAGPITLPRLAALVGLSAHQLLIAFRQRFGTTPAQYVIAERLCRARWLLANTRCDISTIALATGFASHGHLTTTFRRHIGVTPREFRQSSA